MPRVGLNPNPCNEGESLRNWQALVGKVLPGIQESITNLTTVVNQGPTTGDTTDLTEIINRINNIEQQITNINNQIITINNWIYNIYGRGSKWILFQLNSELADVGGTYQAPATILDQGPGDPVAGPVDVLDKMGMFRWKARGNAKGIAMVNSAGEWVIVAVQVLAKIIDFELTQDLTQNQLEATAILHNSPADGNGAHDYAFPPGTFTVQNKETHVGGTYIFYADNGDRGFAHLQEPEDLAGDVTYGILSVECP